MNSGFHDLYVDCRFSIPDAVSMKLGFQTPVARGDSGFLESQYISDGLSAVNCTDLGLFRCTSVTTRFFKHIE